MMHRALPLVLLATPALAGPDLAALGEHCVDTLRAEELVAFEDWQIRRPMLFEDLGGGIRSGIATLAAPDVHGGLTFRVALGDPGLRSEDNPDGRQLECEPWTRRLPLAEAEAALAAFEAWIEAGPRIGRFVAYRATDAHNRLAVLCDVGRHAIQVRFDVTGPSRYETDGEKYGWFLNMTQPWRGADRHCAEAS